MKQFDTGVIVGRFQHIHIGHEKLINIGLDLCNTLIVFVSSANKCNIRNPFDVNTRIDLMKKIYESEINENRLIIRPLNDITDETDLTHAWGEFVVKECEKILNKKLDVIIYGKDKNINKCFSPGLVEGITEIFVDRKTIEISATKMREYLLNDDKNNWSKYTNKKIHDQYDFLKEKWKGFDGK